MTLPQQCIDALSGGGAAPVGEEHFLYSWQVVEVPQGQQACSNARKQPGDRAQFNRKHWLEIVYEVKFVTARHVY